MNLIKDSMAKLGLRGKDRVTGFHGVVSSVNFDLYGCVQVALTPPVDATGKPVDGAWYDIKRIDFAERVMDAPVFEQVAYGAEAGAAEKPRSMPR